MIHTQISVTWVSTQNIIKIKLSLTIATLADSSHSSQLQPTQGTFANLTTIGNSCEPSQLQPPQPIIATLANSSNSRVTSFVARVAEHLISWLELQYGQSASSMALEQRTSDFETLALICLSSKIINLLCLWFYVHCWGPDCHWRFGQRNYLTRPWEQVLSGPSPQPSGPFRLT